MIENNGVLSKIDPRMFYWFYITGSLLDILVLQIGDFIWSGSEKINMIFKVDKNKILKLSNSVELTVPVLIWRCILDNIVPIQVDPIKESE